MIAQLLAIHVDGGKFWLKKSECMRYLNIPLQIRQKEE